MSDDFRKLIEDIETEAKAEGPASEAELRELRRDLSMASQLVPFTATGRACSRLTPF